MKETKARDRLIDSHGRRIRKLRLSLLDACNFRCFYCMPVDAKFMHSSKWLTVREIARISAGLVRLGVEQIRITGGEPTLRKNFREIVSRLSELPLQKLGLTSNGFTLERELDFLKDTPCQYLNISVDSMDAENFHRITRYDGFDQVKSAVLKASELGFKVKINTVLMRGVNDFEVPRFISFSAQTGIEVRFLELMRIGQACRNQESMYVPANEAIEKITGEVELIPEPVEYDSTSFNFRTTSGARIGFIAPESRPFCESCSRWRLSADGFLRACLMSREGISLRGVHPDDYASVLFPVLGMKPLGRVRAVSQDMNQIGG